MDHTTLQLYKQNFKFSAAHFLIFDEKRAERLHGHNYQVVVDIAVPAQGKVTVHRSNGYFIDFNILKKFIKERLDLWDEFVLLPKLHPEVKLKENGPSLEVYFRDRYYVFPKKEVVLLAVSNTSVEQLSRLLAEDFLSEFKKYGVQQLRVRVEETRGQSASTKLSSKLS